MKRDYTNIKGDNYYYSLINNLELLPFSFKYNEKEYKGFSKLYFELKNEETNRVNDKETKIYTFSFLNALEVKLILTHYFDYGATEFTVYFNNVTNKDSEILKDIKCEFKLNGKYPSLKGILGDHVNQYAPYNISLNNNNVEFSSCSGRATHINFPYFNLEYEDEGIILVIGWAGTWNASFNSFNNEINISLKGVNNLNTYLKPGESIRTPLFILAPYKVRDETYATNYWRSFFIKHNLPKKDKYNNELEPFSTCCLASDTGLPNSDGSISERHTTWRKSLEKMIEEKVKVDFRWFDAGWYVKPNLESEEVDWWGSIGTWELDPIKWPNKTFLESTDFARSHNMKTLVWFEPERVTDPLNLEKNFSYNSSWAIKMPNENVISNNIGDTDCFSWTLNRITKMLKENKVELYREDNNCNAKKLWDYLDEIEGENRNGITECKFIDAHYRLWDEIINCTKELDGCAFVDSCASGGGRNDIESLRRGIPLLRSDSDRTSSSLRLSMTSSFNKWIPFCGASSKEKLSELALTGVSDKYVWRASYLPVLNISTQFTVDKNVDFDNLRFGLNEWKKISPYLLKEFYTLTPYHKENDKSSFTAFAYFDCEKEEGIILAFRQENCEEKILNVTLPFIDDSSFILIDEDTKEQSEISRIISLFFEEPRSAKLLWIKKKY